MEREYFEPPSDYVVETYKDYKIIETYRFGSTQYKVYDPNGIWRGGLLLEIDTARKWVDLLEKEKNQNGKIST